MDSASNPPSVIPPRPLAENRRRGNRHRLSIPATLQIEGGDPAPIAITITEISIGGIGMRTHATLPLDGIYQVISFDTLVVPGMRVRIVSQQNIPDGTFKIGAKII